MFSALNLCFKTQFMLQNLFVRIRKFKKIDLHNQHHTKVMSFISFYKVKHSYLF